VSATGSVPVAAHQRALHRQRRRADPAGQAGHRVCRGGAEEVHWGTTVMFDGMGALSSGYNDAPEKASRAYDANRDGFVISGGAGILVLEELEHALGAVGADPFASSSLRRDFRRGGHGPAVRRGAVRCMRMALQNTSRPSTT